MTKHETKVIVTKDFLDRVHKALDFAIDNTIDCSNNIPYYYNTEETDNRMLQYRNDISELEQLKHILES